MGCAVEIHYEHICAVWPGDIVLHNEGVRVADGAVFLLRRRRTTVKLVVASPLCVLPPCQQELRWVIFLCGQ